jgi:hypothetical protein
MISGKAIPKPLVALLLTSFATGQGVKGTSIPLGNALDHALEMSSLTRTESRPFHLKVHLFESTNPSSDYHAEIEEYWVSAQQWRRTVESAKFKQGTVTNGAQTSEQNAGDYYPLWLRNFVTGIFDPVPHSDLWTGSKISQITLPNGQRSDACARLKFKVGSETVQNDAFATICFEGEGLLKFVGMPGYEMEFHEYKRFGKQMIARRYQDDPEPGTEIVANVVLLEEYKNPNTALFLVEKPTSDALTLRSIRVSQKTVEAAAAGQAPLTWPKVQSGKTEGVLSMYISVDREGNVREAYPLNADNPGLQDTARDQLLKWKLKPMTANGVPIQAEAALTFRFETSLTASTTQPK